MKSKRSHPGVLLDISSAPLQSRWSVGAIVALLATGVGLMLVPLVFDPGQPDLASTQTAPASTMTVPAAHPAPVAREIAMPTWDERWHSWLARLSAPGDDAALAAEFEELVNAAPRRALLRAQREPNQARRESLIPAVLLLWAEADPIAAAAHARTLPDSERGIGVAAVLAGASHQPSVAVKFADEFCRSDPSLAYAHGRALITALGRVGEHRAAIRFALEDHNAEPGEDNNKWLKAAFAQWAAKDPHAALAALHELPDEAARFEALDAVVTSRLRIDPAGIAETLRLSPSGHDRDLALGRALRTWADQDPASAATWLDQLHPSPELDAGAKAIATQPQLEHRPDVALSWAESIASAESRSRTVSMVVQRWADRDAATALHYIQTSPHLLPEDRAKLLAAVTP
jgi:hypothetical protein